MSNQSNQKIKFGLVGCGRISGKHIEALAGLYDKAVLTCLCDVIEQRACNKASEYMALIKSRVNNESLSKSDFSESVLPTTALPVPVLSETVLNTSAPAEPVAEEVIAQEPRIYTDLSDMINREPIDVLSICTPSGLHPIHGIMAAEKQIHVLTEKPMAVSLEMADALIRTCDEASVRLFVVLQNRLNSTVRLLKKAIDKGRFGKLYSLYSNVLWFRPQSYYDEAAWRGTWELDGGAVLNQASHYADSLQWLGGPVDSVTAMTGTLARRMEAEDTGCAIIKFKNGAIGSLNVSMLTYPSNLEGSLTVIGEKGTVRLSGIAINKIEKWVFEQEDPDDELVVSSSYEPPDIYGFGHRGYYANVLEVLKGNRKAEIDGVEGRKSLELISAIYKSTREGRIVKLPL